MWVGLDGDMEVRVRVGGGLNGDIEVRVGVGGGVGWGYGSRGWGGWWDTSQALSTEQGTITQECR